MLKAHMINKFGSESIYYKDNPNRTITLENCVKKVFTNDKAPLRRNLEKIIELRNTSTHFITEEYEMVYIPLFQATVFNFIEEMQAFHDVDMTEIIPQNFLTLTVSYNALDTALVFCLRYIVHHRLLPKLPQVQDFFRQIVVVLVTFCSVDQLTLKVFHSCVKVLNRSRIHLLDRKLKVLLQYFQVFPVVSDDLIDRFQKGILQNVLPDCP